MFGGGTDNQYTCKASRVAEESRIDYIFVNRPLYPAVRGFQVDYCDEYSCHQPLQLRLDAGDLSTDITKVRKTTSAANSFEAKLDKE